MTFTCSRSSGYAAIIGASCLAAALAAADSPDVRRMLQTGSYAEAEREAAAWVAGVEAREGPDSLAAARALDLLIEALLKNGKGASASTLALAERVIRLKVDQLGAEHPESAPSLHNLGDARVARGEFTHAVTLHEHGLRIRAGAIESNDSDVAESLERLAYSLIQLQRFQEARTRLDEAKRIRELHVDDSLRLAGTLELIGLLFRHSGSYAEAVAPLDRALEIRRKLSPAHPEMVGLLQVRGDVYLLMGETRTAQETWSSALVIAEKTLRSDHPAFAEILRRLGFAAFSLGNLTEARLLRERALAVGESSLAPCDPAIVALLNAVAASRRFDGDYAAARQVYVRARQRIDACAGVNAAGTASEASATACFNEASLAEEMHDLAEADRLYQCAVRTWSKGLGPDHPFVARGLQALAEVVEARGQRVRARTLYERVLTMRERSLGMNHPHVAWTLTSLAENIAKAGNLRLALRYVERAEAIYRMAGASDEPDRFPTLLELRGRLEGRLGNQLAARASMAEALTEREHVLGSTHPDVADTRARLAALDYALGDVDASLRDALQAEDAFRDHLQTTIRYLPERLALAYATKRPGALDLAVSIGAEHMSYGRQVLDAIVRSRGVLLDEFAGRSRSSVESDATFVPLQTALARARQRFANLVVRSLEDSVPRSTLDDARSQKEDAERALAARSATFRAELRRQDIGLEQIESALPLNTVFLSIVRYNRTVDSQSTAPHYAVFVLSAGRRDPLVVQLGSARTIERAIDRWRHEAGVGLLNGASPAAAEAAYRTAGDRLRKLTWDPLAPHLGDAQRVFVVPDGALSLVNFSALPIGPSEYLVERAPTIHYLATERDLATAPGEIPTATGLFALGGPAFDDAAGPVRRSNSSRRGAPGDCGTLQSIMFERLPATLAEANEVAALWKTAAAGTPGIGGVHLSTAEQATERAFKQQAPGRRVLHLATHGFFLGGDCGPVAPGTRAVGRITAARPVSASAIATQNPLLVSGLAFAGANLRARAKPDEEDGILTAEEIAGMNLQGTEWAVLSACDTGLGAVRAGEGVFGLRRAFQIAGVRTVIMSLWSVEDEATRRWMRALYHARLDERLDTAESVRAATLRVLQDRRARRLSTHPFHWGAFVSAGDWR